MNQDEKKRKVAEASLEYIESGQVIGIGTGSTVNCLIDLMEKIKSKIVKKYDIKCIDSFVEAGSGSLPTEKICSVAIIFQNNKIMETLL